MKRRPPHQITAAAFFFLLSQSSALAQISGNTTTVTGAITGPACGNTGGSGGCSGANVPGPGDSTDVIGNSLIITTTGSVSGEASGGITYGNGNANGNTALVNGHVDQSVFGGVSYDGGNARNNTVNVRGGSVSWSVVGGSGSDGVSGNTAIVESGSTIGGNVTGGIGSGNGSVSGNTAIVESGSTVGANVTGGEHYGSGDVTDNAVTVSGRVFGHVIGAVSNFSSTSISVSGNRVTLKSSGFTANSVYGGLIAGTGDVADNSVTIGGTVMGDVFGGFLFSGTVSGNRVTLESGGSVGGDVHGGYTLLDTGAITDNLVSISGSVAGSVIGGSGVNGAVSNNTVTLNQGALVGGGVYGGVIAGTGTSSGNTLNVNRFQGSLRDVGGFDHYNFDADGFYAGDTLITITGATATDLAGATVNVSTRFASGAFTSFGDTITLIDQATGAFTTGFAGQGYSGLSEVYILSLHDNNGALVLELLSSLVNPQTAALSQGLISDIVTLNRATDLLTGAGLAQARAALRQQGEGPALFASLSYGDTRTRTGSHLDSDGWSGLLGIAWDEGNPDRTGWMAGGVFEFGQGDWSAHNDYGGHGTVYSEGDTRYYGVGLLGQYRFASRLRFDASARIGRVETDYQARGYAAGRQPAFDLAGTYYSAHAGTGTDIALGDSLTLDLSARYLWTHRQGESVTILDERVHFADINSHRVRAGGRLAYEAGPVIRPYAGLYGEYEFDGKSRARNLTAGIDHHPLKIRGATAIAEIGAALTPGDIPGLSLELSLQGHAGRREGIVGSAGLTWKF